MKKKVELIPHQTIFNFFKQLDEHREIAKEIIEHLKEDYEKKGVIPVSDPSVQSEPLNIKENLIDLKSHDEPRLLSLPTDLIKKYGFSDTPVRLYMRIGTYCALLRLLQNLPEHLGIYVYEGYRAIEDQQQRFFRLSQKLQTDHPDWDASKVEEEASKLVCPVKPGVIPPHTTGGALDIIPFVLSTGELLTMGLNPDWSKTKVETFSDSDQLSEVERGNRLLLLNAATQAGFVNYNGEFWHYSIGDSYWANYAKQPSLYSGLLLEEAQALCL